MNVFKYWGAYKTLDTMRIVCYIQLAKNQFVFNLFDGLVAYNDVASPLLQLRRGLSVIT